VQEFAALWRERFGSEDADRVSGWLAAMTTASPHPQVMHLISLLRYRLGLEVGLVTNDFSTRGANSKEGNASRGVAEHPCGSLVDLCGRPLFDFCVQSSREGCRKGASSSRIVEGSKSGEQTTNQTTKSTGNKDDEQIFEVALSRSAYWRDRGKVDSGRGKRALVVFVDDLPSNLIAPKRMGFECFLCRNPQEAVTSFLEKIIPGFIVPHVSPEVLAPKRWVVPDVKAVKPRSGIDERSLAEYMLASVVLPRGIGDVEDGSTRY